MTILTVGAGQDYATLAGAIAASQDGDVIDVQAGTYTDDFATITTNITIQGIGGMVNLVAASAPPNGKAILVTHADVTLVHVAFSGAAVADENGAGIRYEAGDLTLVGDSFTDNQDGLLAADNPDGRIDIHSSEFGFNGIGNGLTHNLYVNEIGTLTISDSYFHDAVGGNEVKSRAETTVIANTRIIDGDTQTGGGYDVDLPNGGTATLTSNTIVKGAGEPNGTLIHYGGEAAPYAGSVLTVGGNLLVDNAPSGELPRVVNNDQNAGAGATAVVQGNTIYNVPSANVLNGPGVASGNTLLAGSPSVDTSSPVMVPALIDITLPAGAVAATDGVAINPFAGIGFAMVSDATISVVLGGWLTGVLAYDGSDDALTVAAGTDTITATGAASEIVAALSRGDFTYTANAGSSGDTLSLALAGPNLFLSLTAGHAAVATSTVAQAVAATACYRAGTRIATPRGERDVASLAAGDEVLTASGVARRIRFVGRRGYAAAQVGRHAHLQPIRIGASALGAGLPRRDLFVSPRHAMLIDGVLVPAEALVDGERVTRCGAAISVSYVHVELDSHDVILAEGAPSETFCDCDNRWMFDNADADAAPAAASAALRWATCAPLVDGGTALATIRARLGLGAAMHASVALVADDRRVTPARQGDGVFVFHLPAVPRRLRLVSPSRVPRETGEGADARRLGVAVHSIAFAAAGLRVILTPDSELLCDGFHDAERAQRWTDGDAALPLDRLGGVAGPVEVTIAATELPRVARPRAFAMA